MYYELIPANPANLVLHLIYDETSPSYLLFRKGVYYSEINHRPLLYMNKNISNFEQYDFLESGNGPFLVSPKLAMILDEIAKDDVQLIDADIKINDEVLGGYKIPNIITVISCLDTQNASYQKTSTGITILKMKCIDNSLGNHKIVRMKEDIGTIIVNGDIVNSCKKNKVKGIKFFPC